MLAATLPAAGWENPRNAFMIGRACRSWVGSRFLSTVVDTGSVKLAKSMRQCPYWRLKPNRASQNSPKIAGRWSRWSTISIRALPAERGTLTVQRLHGGIEGQSGRVAPAHPGASWAARFPCRAGRALAELIRFQRTVCDNEKRNRQHWFLFLAISNTCKDLADSLAGKDRYEFSKFFVPRTVLTLSESVFRFIARGR
jgi:hypothetical protein